MKGFKMGIDERGNIIVETGLDSEALFLNDILREFNRFMIDEGPSYDPTEVAFCDEYEEENNYCLVTLKAGQFQRGISNEMYSSIIGDGNFDIMYWKEFDTLEIGDLSIDTKDVFSVMTLDKEEFDDASEYGHLMA